MKKILILIIIILLGVMCYNTITEGIQVANFSVMGIDDIKKENENLDNTIEQVKTLQETNYPAKLTEIRTASKELLTKRSTYEELKKYSSEQELLNAGQSERYNVEVLWTKIGNYATENGIVPKMEILSSSTNTPNANDLKITATGSYIALTDFIRDIEDDAKLGFSIEEFELVPSTAGDGSNLQATFRVRDIFINQDTITQTTSSSQSYINDSTKNLEGIPSNNGNSTSSTSGTGSEATSGTTSNGTTGNNK